MPGQQRDPEGTSTLRPAQGTTSASQAEPVAFGAVDPLFSLIVPVYNVAPFLPDFLTSLGSQPYEDYELIFINDARPRLRSANRTWTETAEVRARLVEQPNQGFPLPEYRPRARRGHVGRFPDPDDVLGEDYLSRVRSFIDGEGRYADRV